MEHNGKAKQSVNSCNGLVCHYNRSLYKGCCVWGKNGFFQPRGDQRWCKPKPHQALSAYISLLHLSSHSQLIHSISADTLLLYLFEDMYLLGLQPFFVREKVKRLHWAHCAVSSVTFVWSCDVATFFFVNEIKFALNNLFSQNCLKMSINS